MHVEWENPVFFPSTSRAQRSTCLYWTFKENSSLHSCTGNWRCYGKCVCTYTSSK